jgi:hypothetical protein
MSQEKVREEPQRSRIYIGLEELSSKQRGAVLGLLKDMGFSKGEIKEVVVQMPEEDDSRQAEQREGKRK